MTATPSDAPGAPGAPGALGVPDAPDAPDVARLRRAVLRHGGRHLRPLPWRATRDPWAVLVSEVMLQQTQAARVVGPFGRFLDAFPTPAGCAAAPVADVLVAWSGLGYNRRALALRNAAVAVVERHGGSVPDEVAALEALPGVGPYTARAVCAFAFERAAAPVDVNVARVLARAVAGAPLGRSSAQALADGLVPPGRAWLWGQSLMEIGATWCRSGVPDCAPCPLAPCCAWRRAGAGVPDPAPARRRAGGRFEGSDRQVRGRLLEALRRGALEEDEVPVAAGCPDDPGRALALAGRLVADGLAVRGGAGGLQLP